MVRRLQRLPEQFTPFAARTPTFHILSMITGRHSNLPVIFNIGLIRSILRKNRFGEDLIDTIHPLLRQSGYNVQRAQVLL